MREGRESEREREVEREREREVERERERERVRSAPKIMKKRQLEKYSGCENTVASLPSKRKKKISSNNFINFFTKSDHSAALT